jgi:hypothetical protein
LKKAGLIASAAERERIMYSAPMVRSAMHLDGRLVANLKRQVELLNVSKSALQDKLLRRSAPVRFTGVVLKKRTRGQGLMFIDLSVPSPCMFDHMLTGSERRVEVIFRDSVGGFTRKQVNDMKRDLKAGDECTVGGATVEPATDSHPCVLHCTFIDFVSLQFGGNAGESRRVTISEQPEEGIDGQELLHGARVYEDDAPAANEGHERLEGYDQLEVPLWLDPEASTKAMQVCVDSEASHHGFDNIECTMTDHP